MDRIDRISEEVRRELSDIIQNSIKDPRLPAFVSVTGVRVAKDLKHAKAFVSVLGTDEQKKDAIKALVSASGFIRHEIGQRVRLRFTPEFHFELDDSIEHGIRIGKLISDTMAAQKAATAAAPESVETPSSDASGVMPGEEASDSADVSTGSGDGEGTR